MSNTAFIAGKITGDPDYKAKFDKAQKELEAQGYIVMNPAVLPLGFEHEQYMMITREMLRCCDNVYFLNGWRDSEGAVTEWAFAGGHGKNILYEGDE